MLPIGEVSHLAEKLVIIRALPGTPPFDEGTVIWSKERKSIAKVYKYCVYIDYSTLCTCMYSVVRTLTNTIP